MNKILAPKAAAFIGLKTAFKKDYICCSYLGRRRDCLFYFRFGSWREPIGFLGWGLYQKNNSLFVSNDKNLIWRDRIFESKQSTIELLLKVTGF